MLGRDRDRVIRSPCCGRLVDEVVGLGGLVRDGVDGTLEDIALATSHGGMLVGALSQVAAEVAAETNYLRSSIEKPQVDSRARRASIPRSPP